MFAASEMVPFAKTGGLADVAGALPKALIKDGVDVAAVLPKYGTVDDRKFELKETGIRIKVPVSGSIKIADVLVSRISEVPVYFIKNEKYYAREGLYGNKGGDYPD